MKVPTAQYPIIFSNNIRSDLLYLRHKRAELMSKTPIPANEVERLSSLENLDLDYSDLQEDFKDIVELTSKISGMGVSLINLIDPYTQWTIAQYGLDLEWMPREESVCQYTIMNDTPFEVPDLSADERFKDRYYVTGPADLKYYFGIPLTTGQGVNIGALCVLDTEPKKISEDDIVTLRILAREIVKKLKTYTRIAGLKDELLNASKRQKKTAQDVRDPLSGIIGISEILLEQQCEPKSEALEYISLINESSKLILQVTDEVLVENIGEKEMTDESFSLLLLQEKLTKLYRPLAEHKNISLTFISEPYKVNFPIPKSSVLQIAGTLISSAINLLPPDSALTVELDINVQAEQNKLNITINGGTPPYNLTDSAFSRQVMFLAEELAKKLNGELKLSGESENLTYRLSLPFND